jgi:hypothetical protein
MYDVAGAMPSTIILERQSMVCPFSLYRGRLKSSSLQPPRLARYRRKFSRCRRHHPPPTSVQVRPAFSPILNAEAPVLQISLVIHSPSSPVQRQRALRQRGRPPPRLNSGSATPWVAPASMLPRAALRRAQSTVPRHSWHRGVRWAKNTRVLPVSGASSSI